MAVFKDLTILLPQLGLVCSRLLNASKKCLPFFLNGKFCLNWMAVVLSGCEKAQWCCPPNVTNGHWAWLSFQLVIFTILAFQVFVPRFNQKHHSHRTEPEPASGDYPFHHWDPDLGRSEWQLCVWVRVSNVLKMFPSSFEYVSECVSWVILMMSEFEANLVLHGYLFLYLLIYKMSWNTTAENGEVWKWVSRKSENIMGNFSNSVWLSPPRKETMSWVIRLWVNGGDTKGKHLLCLLMARHSAELLMR